jgi:sugar lactone lactonase YvrE
MNAALCLDIKAKLGEGAIWSPLNNKLYWVDIEGMCFNIFDPLTLENQAYPTKKRIGTVVPIDAGNVLVALEDGIATINLTDGEVKYRLNTDIHHQHHKRFNDGKCDPNGRFWVGTHSMSRVPEVSSLYCIGEGFSFEEKITGVSISNGIAWSLDGRLMYYIDTPTGKVVQYDFNGKRGAISNKKTIITIPEEEGYPDGMTIDSDGMLWIALWDGFAVAQYNPHTGEVLQKIDVPVPKVTSCAFGGENLDTLFITTASVEMTDEELAQYPLSGSIFTAKVNAKGAEAFHFKL